MPYTTNKDKICLITGASGFLGQYICKELEKREYKLISLSRRTTYAASQIKCDLVNSIPTLSKLSRLEVVVHAAGKAHIIPNNKADEQEFRDVNVRGTQNLLKALDFCVDKPKGFVFVSTVAVYGCEEGQMINESYPLGATSAYGLSKIEAENAIIEWGNKNEVPVVILRLPLVVGQNPPGNMGGMINAMRKGYYFRIGSGSTRRSWVWASDVASIIPKVTQFPGTYNLTDGYHPTLKEIENCLATLLGNRSVIKIPFSVAKVFAVSGNILNTFGWKSFPFNSYRLNKLTKSLTFSDDKAKQTFNWNPVVIISHCKEVFKI